MAGSFPSAPLERIARKAGAERVSASAVEALNEVLTEIAEQIAKEASAASNHAGRVTIKRDDIKLASR